MSSGPTILFVDDVLETLKYFTLTFSDKFNVITADNPESARTLLQDREQEIAVVVADQRLPGSSGVQLLEFARQCRPQAPRILVTAYSQTDLVVKAINDAKIFAFLEKPWKPERMDAVIAEAVNLYERERTMWQDGASRESSVRLVLPSWIIDLPYVEAKRKCLAEFDRSFVTQSLERYDHNISAFARSRRISRKTIQRINKRLRLFKLKAGRKPGSSGDDDDELAF